MSKFICDICGKSLTHRSSLYNHKKSKHSPSEFHCDLCPFCSHSKYSLMRHKKTKHSDQPPVNRTRIKCALCSESYFSKVNVVQHYINYHNVPVKNETVLFLSEGDFYAWKGKVEREEACEYVRKHTKYVSKVFGTTNMTFVCHRNGKFISRSENKRRLKIIGSNKIDGYCPAKMVCCFEPSGNVTVLYCKNHVGHQPEIGRMRLSTSDKQSIADKIASKIPFEKILDDIKLSVSTSEIDRIHLITRKDLLNIKQRYNLKMKAVQNKIESVGIESWIHEMKDELKLSLSKGIKETTKKHKADVMLQFLNVIDKAKTEEDFKIISKHLQPLLSTVEEQETKAQLQSSTSHHLNSIAKFEKQRRFLSTKISNNTNISVTNPTNCEKDAVAAILLLEENNCQPKH